MDADGKQTVETRRVPEGVIEAVTRQALEDAARPAGPGAAPQEKKPPAGTVERVLNFKDRNYLVGACRSRCEQDGHKTFKDQRKLDQLIKLVNFDSTLDHLAANTDALEEATLIWESDTVKHRAWKRLRLNLLDDGKTEEFRKKYPDVDLDQGPKKPSLRPPETSKEDQRGPDSTFYFPSKLDAWVQDALRVMDWPTTMTEFSVELCEKFGVEEIGSPRASRESETKLA